MAKKTKREKDNYTLKGASAKDLESVLKKNKINFKKHVGILDFYFETGFEYLLVHIYDGNDLEHRSHEHIITISEGDFLEVDGEIHVLAKDLETMAINKNSLSFYPMGQLSKKWRKLVKDNKKVTLWKMGK